MKINFFEEYPTEENMSKLDLVDWPCIILVAATSLEEFEVVREKYSSKYPHIIFGWWPTLPGSYWISGFSNSKDLKNIFANLTSKVHSEELPVLMDMELPRIKKLYFKNLFNIGKNKKIISDFFVEAPKYNLKIYTAEYPAPNKIYYWFWKILGISPSFSHNHTKIPMCYSSMGIKSIGVRAWNKVKNFEKDLAIKNQNRVAFGLGTIAIGVLGNEPILSPEDLVKDIKWVKECNVDEVFIFRLGGIDTSYLDSIKEAIK